MAPACAVASQEQLTGRLVAMHFDPLTKRQLALVVSPQQQQDSAAGQQQGANVLQAQRPTAAGGADGSSGSALMVSVCTGRVFMAECSG